jgi:hypothetical protein
VLFARVASHVDATKLGAAARNVEYKYSMSRNKVILSIQHSKMGIYMIANNTSVNTKHTKKHASHPMITRLQPLKSRPTTCSTMTPSSSVTTFILTSQTQETQSLLDRGTSTSGLVCRLFSMLCVDSEDITCCSFPHRRRHLWHFRILPRRGSQLPVS